jgi:hypothetical protein
MKGHIVCFECSDLRGLARDKLEELKAALICDNGLENKTTVNKETERIQRKQGACDWMHSWYECRSVEYLVKLER